MKIIAFNGSPRNNGNTQILIDTVLKPLKASGAECKVFQLGGSGIKPCTGCRGCYKNKNRKCAQDDIFNTFTEDAWNANAMIIASPTYFANPTPEIKCLIDRLGYVNRANGGLLKHKAGAAIAVHRRAGGIFVLDAVQKLFFIADMYAVGSSYWNVVFGREPGDVLKDEEGMTTMQNLGDNILHLLQKLQK